MSDFRKLIDILSESSVGATVSGNVATLEQSSFTQRREPSPKSEAPQVLEYGMWENSALTTSKKLKKTRSKAKELVSKRWGEDAPIKESVEGVAEGSGDKIHLKTPKHGLADHPGRDTGVGLRTFAQTPEQDRCPKCNSLFKNHYKQSVAEGSEDKTAQQRKTERDKQRTAPAKKARDTAQRKGLTQDKDGTYYAKEGVAEGSEQGPEVYYMGRLVGWKTGERDGRILFKPNPSELPDDVGRTLSLPVDKVNVRGEQGVAETTGDKKFDDMISNIAKSAEINRIPDHLWKQIGPINYKGMRLSAEVYGNDDPYTDNAYYIVHVGDKEYRIHDKPDYAFISPKDITNQELEAILYLFNKNNYGSLGEKDHYRKVTGPAHHYGGNAPDRMYEQGVAEAGYQSPHAKLAQLQAKYEVALKSRNPNPNTLRRIRDQIIKLEFDLGIKKGVAEGFLGNTFNKLKSLVLRALGKKTGASPRDTQAFQRMMNTVVAPLDTTKYKRLWIEYKNDSSFYVQLPEDDASQEELQMWADSLAQFVIHKFPKASNEARGQVITALVEMAHGERGRPVFAEGNEEQIDEVAGPKSCWPGHRKVGTQPGTGKNAGQRVNKCKKISKSKK